MSGERRKLSRFDLCCLGVNAIVGSSVFLIPGKLFGLLGPASVVALALTGLLLAPIALCFAEAGGRFEGHGGPYLYAREAFGANAGFAIGWLCWMTEVLSWAAVADGLAAYLAYFHPAFEGAAAAKIVGASTILILAAVNYRGLRPGAWTADAFTVAKLLPLLLLACVGLPHLGAVAAQPFAPHGFKPLGSACLLAYFAFQGFEVVPVPAGDTENPRRDVPFAVLGSLLGAGLLYILIQLVAVGSGAPIASSPRPLAAAAAVLLGPWGAGLIAVGAAVSMVGFNAGCALGGPRYLAALGERGDMPDGVATRHERFGTPTRAIVLTATCAAVAALALDFESLVDVVDVVIGAQYLATCVAVPLLRRKLGQSQGFRAPGGWLAPVAGIAAALWLGSQVQRKDLLATAGLLAAGFILRAVLTQARKQGTIPT